MPPANRLLVLDDDSTVAMTLSAIARRVGFEVRYCLRPDEFFDAATQWQPSHIAVDLVMPELDGTEVLRRLAENGCTAQIIITSGMGSPALEAARQQATGHGLSIRGVLPKPFRAQLLRELLLDADPGSPT